MQARGLWPLAWSLRAGGNVIRVLPELLLALLFAGAERTDQMWVALELRGGWANAPIVLSDSRSTAATLLLTGHTVIVIGLMIISTVGILK
jgi:energy-coupling factor transporter transmembrane protein EcfT